MKVCVHPLALFFLEFGISLNSYSLLGRVEENCSLSPLCLWHSWRIYVQTPYFKFRKFLWVAFSLSLSYYYLILLTPLNYDEKMMGKKNTQMYVEHFWHFILSLSTVDASLSMLGALLFSQLWEVHDLSIVSCFVGCNWLWLWNSWLWNDKWGILLFK